WYGPDDTLFVAMTKEEAQAKAEAHYGESVTLRQDPDVLDTWFSSGLWPFSTLGWPNNTDSLKKFYPTQVMETGSDILFFWVARMLMMGIYAMGETPFSHVFLHAMVRDEKGQKMSKVKGNVIDPLHMIYGATLDELNPKVHKELIKKIKKSKTDRIDAQGADALRFTLAILAAQARDIKLDVSRMEGYRAFLNKLWNASKFVLLNTQSFTPASYGRYTSDWASVAPPFVISDLSMSDRWILTRLQEVVAGVTMALDQFRFNEAAQLIYDFVWHSFCDWHVELSKPNLYDESAENASSRAATQSCLLYTLDTIVRLLHPVAPFITEDIWQALPRTDSDVDALIVAPWPQKRTELQFPNAVQNIEVAIGLISAVRNIRGETGVKPSAIIEKAYFVTTDTEMASRINASRFYIGRMAKIDQILVVEEESSGEAMATAVSSGVEIRIPLKGLIDVEEELSRIRKELDKVAKDLQFVSKKLNNEKFVSRAPAHIVEKEREKLQGYEQKKAALEKSLLDIEKLRASD
ncbi:MAG: class I tRNA ligase family protein, partial [Myxococcota bacterium]|nr:class I tRNA ligase family protein [Myxococcota bacterium]